MQPVLGNRVPERAVSLRARDGRGRRDARRLSAGASCADQLRDPLPAAARADATAGARGYQLTGRDLSPCRAIASVVRGVLRSRSPSRLRRDAAEFRVTAEAPAVLYDAPSAQGEAAVRLRARRAGGSARHRRRLDQGARRGRYDRLAVGKGLVRQAHAAGARADRRGARQSRTTPPHSCFAPSRTCCSSSPKPHRRRRRRRRPAGSRCVIATARPATSGWRKCSVSSAPSLPMKRVAVLGAGAWGTAIACHLRRGRPSAPKSPCGRRDRGLAAGIAGARANSRYLPGVALPRNLAVTARSRRRRSRRTCSWRQCRSARSTR